MKSERKREREREREREGEMNKHVLVGKINGEGEHEYV